MTPANNSSQADPARIDAAQIDTALGTLINLAGKMRMLSHRAAMFAGLGRVASAGSRSAVSGFDEAVSEFSSIFDTLQHGSKSQAVPAEAAQILKAKNAIPSSAASTINQFIQEAHSLRDRLLDGTVGEEELASFTYFVARDLLQALNEVTGGVSSALQARLDSRTAQEDQTRRAVLDAVRAIENVSRKVKFISLNASIEAARAGEFGRGFSVISAEIRTLSDEAAQATQSILRQMV